MVSLSHWAVAPAVKLGVFGLSRVGAAVAITNGRRSGRWWTGKAVGARVVENVGGVGGEVVIR
jgi:hypothetical protein